MDSMSFIDPSKYTNPWHEPGYSRQTNLFDRPRYTNKFADGSRLIKIVLGARRVGKSSLLNWHIQTLLKTHKPKNVLLLSGDILDLQNKSILDAVSEYCKAADTMIDDMYIFIDEVQEVEHWQKDVKILYDTSNCSLIVTGSASSVIAQETSKLTGRHVVINVYTLSFAEFCDFHTRSQTNKKQGANKSEITRKNKEELFEKYIHIGGYPEFFSQQSINTYEYIKNAIESSLYRDLLNAYGIRNPAFLVDIMKVLADSLTNPISYTTIAKRVGLSEETTKLYVAYLLASQLIFVVHKKGKSHRITKSSNPKYYFNDLGVLQYLGQESRLGHKMENLVFLQLLIDSEHSLSEHIFYDTLDSDNNEVDFSRNDELFEVKASVDTETALKIDTIFGDAQRHVMLIAHNFLARPSSTYVTPIDVLEWLLPDQDVKDLM